MKRTEKVNMEDFETPSWARPAAGALSGAILGAALGGPAGAIIGGVLGFILGAAAEEEEKG